MIKIISINAKGRCELYNLLHKESIPYEVKKNVITTSFAKITFLNEANVTKEILEGSDIVCGFISNNKPLELAQDTEKYIFERVDILVSKLENGADIRIVYKVCMKDTKISLIKTIVPDCDLKTKLEGYPGEDTKYFLTKEEADVYIRELSDRKIREFEEKIEFLKKQKFELLYE